MKRTAFPDKLTQRPASPPQYPSASLDAKRYKYQQILIITGGRILLLLGLLLVWQWISEKLIDPVFISSPLAIASQFVTWLSDGTLWFHTAITLQEALYGLLFGLSSGILVGFLFGLQPALGKIFDPFIVSLYSIPKIALAPLFILWFGIDIQMKVVITAVTVFFLVFFNTLDGVRNVDQDLINAVRLMGGKRRDMVLKVMVPSVLGYVLTGVHIAIPYALTATVIAELIASSRGIGYLIDASATSFHTAGVFAAILVLMIITGLLNAIVNGIERRTSRWKVRANVGRKVPPF